MGILPQPIEYAFYIATVIFICIASLTYAFSSPWVFFAALWAYVVVVGILVSIVFAIVYAKFARRVLLAALRLTQTCARLPLWVIRHVPGLKQVVEVSLIVYFYVSFRFLLFADRVARHSLRIILPSLAHPSKAPISIANASYPTFTPAGEFTTGYRTQSAGEPEQWDPKAAISLANISRLSYEDPALIRHELALAGFDLSTLRIIHYHNTAGFVVRHAVTSNVVVTFRGTDMLNLMHVFTDLQMGMVSLDEIDRIDEEREGEDVQRKRMGKVHYGFLDALRLSTTRQLPSPLAEGMNATSAVRIDTGTDHGEADQRPMTIELDSTTPERTVKSSIKALAQTTKFAISSLWTHTRHPIDPIFSGRSERNITAYAQTAAAINELHQPEKGGRVFVTGHSLGGALALVFFAQAIREKEKWVGETCVYTYGMPRCGDEVFKEWMKPHAQRIFHVVNNNDVVPRVPWRRKEVGYFIPSIFLGQSKQYEPYADPPGTLIHISSSSHLTFPPKLARINLLKLQGVLDLSIVRRMRNETTLRVLGRMVMPFFVNDHFAGDYVVGLKEGTGWMEHVLESARERELEDGSGVEQLAERLIDLEIE
ncbi:hypothetical protein YB2330_000249 [Saitoella coloradoensis]